MWAHKFVKENLVVKRGLKCNFYADYGELIDRNNYHNSACDIFIIDIHVISSIAI
jgi:hypothetical protein